MRHKAKLLTYAAMLLVTLIMAACGGGTMGTGIVPAGFGVKTRGAPISFILAVTVTNDRGKALSGAIVTISGVGGTVVRRSDRLGKARLPLMMQSAEFLEVSVEAGGQRYRSRQQISPAGASEVEQTFVVEPSSGLTFK